jgi:hypothetical protein
MGETKVGRSKVIGIGYITGGPKMRGDRRARRSELP